MEYLWLSLVFLTGACVGSFLNVCIYRIPRGKSVVFPPSYCPSCANTLRFVDLIPLISYLALNRKCRYCGCKISPRYPTVELVTGLLFVLAVTKYGLTLAALRAVVLFSLLIPAALIDLKYKIIPDKLNLAGVILGIPLIVESKEVFFSGVTGFLAGGGLLLLIAVVSRGGMGGGDRDIDASAWDEEKERRRTLRPVPGPGGHSRSAGGGQADLLVCGASWVLGKRGYNDISNNFIAHKKPLLM